MSVIERQDSNGVKPLLQVGELGYDNYPAGGDKGRVYVGTGTENISMAKKIEVTAVDAKVNTHTAKVDNPHSVTKAQVGLSNADNTADINKNVLSATKLTTARTINGVNFDGTANIVAPTNLTVGTRTATAVPIESSTGTNASIPAVTTALAGVMSSADKVKLDGIEVGAQVNVATDLAITAGTTAGPIVTSSTGTNATLPTASATASGVVTTGNQTIAGVKTFTSSPIVPTPTTDFQATTARSTNITVNVGAGQTYTTIGQALEYLSGFYPLHKTTGVTATINLKAGFVMAEQVLVSGLNLGWITIVGEDAETIITHTSLTTAFNGSYPAFGADKGGTTPVIGQLFRFNVEKVGGSKYGLIAYGAGSSADVLSGKGFIGAGTIGILANLGSTINAYNANASNAGVFGIYASASSTIDAYGANASNAGNVGILANLGSTINAYNANASNAGVFGIYAYQGSTINAHGAIIQNQTTGTSRVKVQNGSHIEASGINTTGGTVPALSQTANTLTAAGIIYQ